MEQLEKVVKGLECCLPETQEQAESSCAACPYDPCGVSVSLPISLIDDARKLIAAQRERINAQDEVIQALRKVGYPHDFQREKPWIVNYMYAITDVIKKAVRLDE